MNARATTPAREALCLVLGIIGFAALIYLWNWYARLPDVWVLVATPIILIGLYLIASSIRQKRRLGKMAFEDWIKRCQAIARQRDIVFLPNDNGSGKWSRRWLGGLTPDEAVQQELDARELGVPYAEPDQPWPRR